MNHYYVADFTTGKTFSNVLGVNEVAAIKWVHVTQNIPMENLFAQVQTPRLTALIKAFASVTL